MKKIVTCLLTFVFAFMLSLSVLAAQEGTDGGNIKWRLDEDTGLLTVSGSGDMQETNFGLVGWELARSVKEIVVKEGVTSLGRNAFMACPFLTKITLPNSLTRIDDSAFNGVPALTEIYIPKNVSQIHETFFSQIDGKVIIDKENPNFFTDEFEVIYNKDKTELLYAQPGSDFTEYTVPDGVKKIGNCAFVGLENLKVIHLPEGLEEIGSQAFSAVPLTTVVLPSTLKSIGNSAFSGCSEILELTVPKNVSYIGNRAFAGLGENVEGKIVYESGNKNFTEKDGVLFSRDGKTLINYLVSEEKDLYTVPNGVETIDESAFQSAKIKEIVFPKSLKTIKARAFSSAQFERLTIPGTLETVEDRAFGFSTVKYLKIEKNSIEWGTNVFNGCRQLEEIVLEDGVEKIPEAMFYTCSALKRITVPGSVKFIGKNAFYTCDSLEEVVLEEGVDNIGIYAFAFCKSLKKVTVPASLKNMESRIFYNCEALTDITIAEGFEAFGESMFSGCNALKILKVPKSVKSMGNASFGNCSSLEAIFLDGKAPTHAGVFTFNQSEAFTVYCRNENLDSFKNNNDWNKFKLDTFPKIKEVEQINIPDVENGTDIKDIKLPEKINLVFNDFSKVSANVKWDTDKCTYDKTVKEEQYVSVSGEFTQPAGVTLPSGFSTKTELTFKVLAEFTNPFTDISKEDEYYSAVAYVYSKGIFRGVSDTEFGPDVTMSRAMFVTVLGRVAGVDVSEYNTVSFSDVVAGEWYAAYVEWAAKMGIVLGNDDGTFGVDDDVTVEQALVFIARYMNYMGIDVDETDSLGGFDDAQDISAWALDAVKAAVGAEIYKGKDGKILPGAPCERYLVATMLYNLSRYKS